MNCITVILFFSIAVSIIPDGILPVGLAATVNQNSHGSPAGLTKDSPSGKLLALRAARDLCIKEAHARNVTAHTAADIVKKNALKVTLAAVKVAETRVVKAPAGDKTAAAALADAINEYNAVYVPAEAARTIAYAAASAAAVIAIDKANSTFAIAVKALGL